MKKILVTATLLIAVVAGLTCVWAAEYTKFSSKFVKNFKDCDSYEETVTSEFEGRTFSTTRKIQGWRNGFCKYEETIASPDGSYQLNCLFSGIQVDELYDAMKDRSREPERYDLETFVEEKGPNGQAKYVSRGTTTIKGNKAYIAWAKYQNNPYFCHPQKLK